MKQSNICFMCEPKCAFQVSFSNIVLFCFFAFVDSFLTEMLRVIFPRMVFGRVFIAERMRVFLHVFGSRNSRGVNLDVHWIKNS